MKHESISTRQRVNLLLDRELVREARELGINLSQAAGRALAGEIKATREERWQQENRAAIESSNRWFEERGLPYADLRVR